MGYESEDTFEYSEETKEEQVERILENAVADIPTVNKESNSNRAINDEQEKEKESWEDINYYVETANAKILLETLAPEVSKNEEKKREHKDKLIKYVSIFLGLQFAVIFILIMIVLISIIVFHALGNDFSFDMVKMLFAFFGTYITSVIVELVYILKYIVVNVFDTSISALMELPV